MCTEYCCWQLRENGESQKISGQLWTVCFCLIRWLLEKARAWRLTFYLQTENISCKKWATAGWGSWGTGQLRLLALSLLCRTARWELHRRTIHSQTHNFSRHLMHSSGSPQVECRESSMSPPRRWRPCSSSPGRKTTALISISRWDSWDVVSSSSLSQVSHPLDCTRCI